jgi:hypothetical protein
MQESKHPRQPVVIDEEGTARFKGNAIIEWLFRSGKLNLNETIAMPGVPREDHEQLAQLLGYSIDGAAELPYVSREIIAEADAEAEELRAQRSA